MIQKILIEIQEVDLLVSTCVEKSGGKATGIDMCLHLVHCSDNVVCSYFCMPLDTCNIEYDRRTLYNNNGDVDYSSEVEYDDDFNIVGYTQFRRATQAERMMFFAAYSHNRGYFHEIQKSHWLPNVLLPGSHELADWLYQKPMTVIINDYDKL